MVERPYPTASAWTRGGPVKLGQHVGCTPPPRARSTLCGLQSLFKKQHRQVVVGTSNKKLGAPGIATRSILASSNKKLLGAPGIATRSKDAIWCS